jgi:hypothetical protein
MLRLNGITEERALDNEEFTRDLLRQVLLKSAPEDREARQSFHESAGQLSLKLGLLSYALERDATEVIRLFEGAAKHLVPALALREPPDPDTHRSPWEAEQFINVIVCFGEGSSALETIAQLKTGQYRNPLRKEHEALDQYLKVLLKFLGGGTIDVPALERVITACEAAKATKDDRLFLLPSARGLTAIAAEDEDQWNYSIARLLSAHGQEARKGDLKLLPDGLVSLRAMMLAKLGIDNEMECRAESDYLPLFLLEEDGEDDEE